MTLRESAARAGFEVAFETDRAPLIREFDYDMTLPWSTRDRMRTAARVVVQQCGATFQFTLPADETEGVNAAQ
jgi:hypothetical protein